MVDNTLNTQNTQNTVRGELQYDDKVIQKIVGISLENVHGLLEINGGLISNIKNKLVNTDNPTEGVSVEVGKEQVAVDLNIIAEYAIDIQKVFKQIQDIVVQQVHDMTGLDVVEVNVRVVDIQTREEYEKNSRTVQDQLTDATQTVSNRVSEGTNAVQNNLEEANASRVK
jgi:uncharacterized alkaline shock family protein YloU